MAESQLMCMEDGHIRAKVPETKPEFYYSEEQRAAVEELLRNGDGAFKTRLKDDNIKDFLSAREVKVLVNTFKQYDSADDSINSGNKAHPSRSEQGVTGTDADSGVHSTYWPQMSDTEVPQLDIGWASGGMFKGVTRVAVHTHPPKDNGPHIKEVVRRLIQEANKVIAIVMDILTDIQILQDLMDAAWRRSVPVYILLDDKGVPHFLDMCSRLQIGAQHLQNIRTRTLQGTGFGLSFGRLPGSLCNKYMLVDGEKVTFGSYSFSWSTSRMDRNMITVMTGQVVDFFDRDFRELYAISEKMDLFKEFQISPPANMTTTIRSKAGPKRPPLPATTSRFQVSLGDSRKADIQVPAHKYYNPKYFLVFGDAPRPTASLQQSGSMRESVLAEVLEDMDQGRPRVTSSEKMDRLSPLALEAQSEIFKRPNNVTQEKKQTHTGKQIFSRGKSSNKLLVNSVAGSTSPSHTGTNLTDRNEENFEVMVRSSKRKNKKSSKLSQKTDAVQTVNGAQDNDSTKSRHRSKQGCTVS
ncbi:hypothetical protein PAMP_021443 [Pampus punctatissimus]